jgi:hypothetical protein
MRMRISVLGVDLGKNVCSLVGFDATGAVVLRRRAKRETLIALAVWSRNEMARVDFEGGGVVRPGIADSLIGRSPSQRL